MTGIVPAFAPFTRPWYSILGWLLLPPAACALLLQLVLIVVSSSPCTPPNNDDELARYQTCVAANTARFNETMTGVGLSLGADASWVFPALLTVTLFALGILMLEQAILGSRPWARLARDSAVRVSSISSALMILICLAIFRAEVGLGPSEVRHTYSALLLTALALGLTIFLARFFVGNLQWRRLLMKRRRTLSVRGGSQLRKMMMRRWVTAVSVSLSLALLVLPPVLAPTPSRDWFAVAGAIAAILFLFQGGAVIAVWMALLQKARVRTGVVGLAIVISVSLALFAPLGLIAWLVVWLANLLPEGLIESLMPSLLGLLAAGAWIVLGLIGLAGKARSSVRIVLVLVSPLPYALAAGSIVCLRIVELTSTRELGRLDAYQSAVATEAESI